MLCEFCQQEMETAATCTGNHTALFPDGERLPAVPYTHPTDPEAACGDCNVGVGGYHHPGCARERCPRCHGQRATCNCGSTVASGLEPLIARYQRLRAEQATLERVFRVTDLIVSYLSAVADDDDRGEYPDGTSEAAQRIDGMEILSWAFVEEGIEVVYGYRDEYGDDCDDAFVMPLAYLTDPAALPALRAEVEERLALHRAEEAARLEQARLDQQDAEESARAAQIAAMMRILGENTPGARLMRNTLRGWLRETEEPSA